jgi:hypothetical protein
MQPELFRNVVRQNGEFFMKKYARSRWLVSHS